MANKIHNVIIIGSGPAGLTAAIYAARAELKPIVLAGVEFGGQLMKTTEVENYPGYESIHGPVLMQKMIDQAKKQGAELIFKNVTKVDFSAKPLKVFAGEDEYLAKAVIIATGAKAKMLGVPGENKFFGKGVSVCATCDAAFYREKTVAIVGGGDTAMEEAGFLTKFAKKVYLLIRKDQARASKAMLRRVEENKKIEIMYNTEVEEILGNKVVEELKIQNNKTNKKSKLKVDGLFLAIGHDPEAGVFKGELDVSELGYIRKTERTYTSIDGVFVAGDVEDSIYRQAVVAAGDGCRAALDAERWLASQ